MVLNGLFEKECFGKNNCWNNVRAKCPIAAECRIKAETMRKVRARRSKRRGLDVERRKK